MTSVAAKSLINGVAADYLSINDRAIHYGDGLFETVLCNSNHLFYWQQHYQRLLESASKLQLSCPDEQILLDDIQCLLAENNNANSNTFVVKIILTRGSGERGYVFDKKQTSSRLVLLSNLEASYSSLLTEKLSTGDLFICKQQVSINESLAGLKHLNRLENVLARNEWNTKNNSFVDGLMLNANQYIIEGTMSNLFAVKNNQLLTPDLSQSGVNGVMRNVIIDMAEKNNIKTSITNIRMDELLTMDEVFISNSLIGMIAITKLAELHFNETTITHSIFETLLSNRDDHAQAI